MSSAREARGKALPSDFGNLGRAAVVPFPLLFRRGQAPNKKDACPQPYGEGPRGEPAGRRPVTAAYLPLQQKFHESCGLAAYPPESRDYFPMRTAYLPVNVVTQWRLRVNDTGVGLPADFEVKRGDSL